MNQAEKQESIDFIKTQFNNSSATFVVNYNRCTCEELTSLRKKLKAADGKIAIIKNTLAVLALADTEAKGMGEYFEGPTAMVWSKSDPVSAAKILTTFNKETEKLEIKGGFFDSSLLSPKDVVALSVMPSKEELFSKLLSLLNAPATKLVQVLNAPATELVRLLDAWKNKIEQK